MNRELVDRWCERAILGLVLVILVYGPLALGAVGTRDFLLIQGLTLGVMFLWLARLWLNPKPQLLWPPLNWAVLAFTAYALVRYFTADIEYVARLEVTRVGVYAFLFLVIVNNLQRQEYTHIIALTLVFLAMFIAAYGIYQFMTDSDQVWTFVKPYKHRGSGTYISPNNFAGFLEMILPLGLAWLLVSRAKAVTKVFVGYATLVIVGGILASLSRGGWAGAVASLMVMFALLLRHRNYRLPAMIVLVLLCIGGVFLVKNSQFIRMRWNEMTSNQRFNDSARLDLWEPAIRMWRENVWFGVGPNHYNYRFRAYRPQEIQLQPDRVHNDYLNTLTDWGVVGFVLVSSAWILLYAGVFRTWRYVRGSSADLGGGNSNKFALVLGASTALIAILVHSMIDFNMQIPANAILAITLMAMLTGSLRFATERYWMGARLPSKLLVSALLVAGLAGLGCQLARGTAEYRWLRKAQALPEASLEQVAALKKAFETEPQNFLTAYYIGKALRIQSEYDEQLAQEAVKWLERSAALNPYHAYSYLEHGICLDFPIGDSEAAGPLFEKAVELDPNGYFTCAYMGWHYVQAGDDAAARVWFERSKRLHWDNMIADQYLPIVTERMLRKATNGSSLLLHLNR